MNTLKHRTKNHFINKKAFSAIITTMLFISASFALGILYFQWTLGPWSKNIATQDQWTQTRTDKMKEIMVIESVSLNKSVQPNCTLIVRNVGRIPIIISSVYVDGNLTLSPNTEITVGTIAIFQISVTNNPHNFKVVTSKGSSTNIAWAPR
jgi:hypothetical protein